MGYSSSGTSGSGDCKTSTKPSCTQLTATQPSPKVAVIRFQRGMQQGLLGRISRTSIMEYHAFGIISEGRHSPHHYMICGVQGDFTRGLVANPPKTVWTRELKFGTTTLSSALPSAVMYTMLTHFSWCWPRLRHVPTRHPCLHRHRHWCCPLYLHPVAELVSYLDRFRSRADIRAHDCWSDS